MSKNILRSLVAVCLLGTVACFAAPGDASTIIDVKVLTTSGTGNNNNTTTGYVSPRTGEQVGNGMTISIKAAGANGQLKGKGRLQVRKAVAYPIEVTSGTVTSETQTASGNSGSGASSAGLSSVTTTTLNGFVKPRVGTSVPFVLVATGSDVTMTLTITTITVNGTTTTTTVTTNVLDAVGRVKSTIN